MKILLLLISLNISNYLNQPTKASVYDYMVSKDILYPDIHLKIICVEVGHLKKIKHKNNLCNWRTKSGYLTFDSSWTQSLDYLKSWQDTKYPLHLEKYHKNNTCDYWHFICCSGWKNGTTNCDAASRKYIEYCKKVPINM